MLLLGGCGTASKTVDIPKEIYYTQVNMWYVDKSYTQHYHSEETVSSINKKPLRAQHQIASTNFRRDHLIPINSQVEIVGTDRNTIFLRYDDKVIALRNIKKHSVISTQELFDRSFNVKAVDLSMYTPEERTRILLGEVTKGMSKATILLTRGYPPAHRTPDLNADKWQYWHGRFNSRIYLFEDGKYTGYSD